MGAAIFDDVVTPGILNQQQRLIVNPKCAEIAIVQILQICQTLKRHLSPFLRSLALCARQRPNLPCSLHLLSALLQQPDFTR